MGNMPVASIDDDIAVYEARRPELEAKHMGKWALVHDREIIAILDSFEETAEAAVEKFGRGPYLIRQVGAPPITLPASVMYNPANATNKMRLR